MSVGKEQETSMAKKSKFSANPGTGISSILMIFVVLCITTFGVLSFVSARADLKLTEANAQTVQTYYSAEEKAQRILAQLDALLQRAQALPESATAQECAQSVGLSGTAAQPAVQQLEKAGNAAERYRVLAAYAAASLQEGAAPGDGTQVIYSFALSGVSELRVTVEIGELGGSFRCRVLSEQICETGAGEDQPLNVWPGN
jgi:hypothetical protein